MQRLLLFLCLIMAGLSLSVSNGYADPIKDRMLARLPVINDLKAQGILGENNQGFLEFRTDAKPQADTVQAENQDRATVYKAIAARQNTSVEFVGQARAAQIADNEPSGFWLQNPDGSWRKK